MHDPAPGDDSLATRASLLGRLKNWDDAKSWEEFTQTYSRLIRAVALKAGLTESEAKDVEQETLLCVAKTIHEFESNPARGTFKSWLLNLTRWRIADQFRRRSPAAASAPPSDATATGTATVERVPGPDNLEAEWEAEWKRNMVDNALARVGRKVKPKHLQRAARTGRDGNRHFGRGNPLAETCACAFASCCPTSISADNGARLV